MQRTRARGRENACAIMSSVVTTLILVHASSSLHVIGSCTCTSRGSDRLCSRAVLVHVRGNRRVGKGRGASRERAESSWRSEDGLPQSVCIPHRGCFVSKDAGVWPTARHFKFRVVGSAFPV